jgi:hypothetical protein
VSIRYVETLTFTSPIFPDMPPIVVHQHEHALVTVDEASCEITRWDQYGDNAEQTAVGAAICQVFPPACGG